MGTDTITPAPVWCDPAVWKTLLRQGAALEAAGGRAWPRGLDYLAREADLKVQEYDEYGSAFFGVSPGNGTKYDVMITDLVRAQADYLVRRRLRVRDRYLPDSAEEHRDLLAAARTEATEKHMGPAYAWGGDTLVALPGLNRCTAYGLTDYVDPTFVAEHLGLRRPDAVPISAFLSLFGAAVENHRKAA